MSSASQARDVGFIPERVHVRLGFTNAPRHTHTTKHSIQKWRRSLRAPRTHAPILRRSRPSGRQSRASPRRSTSARRVEPSPHVSRAPPKSRAGGYFSEPVHERHGPTHVTNTHTHTQQNTQPSVVKTFSNRKRIIQKRRRSLRASRAEMPMLRTSRCRTAWPTGPQSPEIRLTCYASPKAATRSTPQTRRPWSQWGALGSMHGESAVMYPNRTSLLHGQAQLMRYHGMSAADTRLFVAGCVGAGDKNVNWLMTLNQQTVVSDRTEAFSKVAWMTRSPRSRASLLVSLCKPASQPSTHLASPASQPTSQRASQPAGLSAQAKSHHQERDSEGQQLRPSHPRGR